MAFLGRRALLPFSFAGVLAGDEPVLRQQLAALIREGATPCPLRMGAPGLRMFIDDSRQWRSGGALGNDPVDVPAITGSCEKLLHIRQLVIFSCGQPDEPR
jgi:hypothetical protein